MRFIEWLALSADYATAAYELDTTSVDMEYARSCFDAGWSVREYVDRLCSFEKIPMRLNAPPYNRRYDLNCWSTTEEITNARVY